MIGHLDWLKKWAHYSPDNIALKDADTGKEYSYRHFYELSNRIARALQSQYGIARGDRIAVLATNEVETIFLFFAAQRLGAVMVPMNFRLMPREVAHILADCTPKLLIHQTQFDEVIAKVESAALPPRLLRYEGPEGFAALCHDESRPSTELEMAAVGDEPCMIIYTSGTTGAPKGAMITPDMLFWNSINTSLRLNLTQSDVNLNFLPFFHTGGWNVLTTPLIHRGGKVILLKKFEADRILELADREGLTILFGVPTMMDMIRNSPLFAKTRLASVRYAIVGGEPMPIELIQAWQERGIPIRQGYGLTEFGPNVFSLNQEDAVRKIGSIGFPNFYIDVKIVGDKGESLGAEQVGELALKGPMCMKGYWGNEEATKNTIRDEWLYTGDLVRKDAEGYFYVVGRKKDMYKSGGENVYPAEVEQFLRTNPKVREAAVIGVSDAKWGEVGKAFIALHPGVTATEQELIEFCQGNLARYKTPRYVRFLPELPKGDSGKILKRALLGLKD